MMRVKIIQRPVGQGGLLHGSLDCGGEPLRWLYDCGSNQTGSLDREIAEVATNPSLHLLFLSHLDSDHVNGVDRLLSRVSVTEVVLPYLSDADLSLAICRDIEAGRLSGVFLDFATDPARWLIGRGVSIVTFIPGRSDDEPPDGGPDGPYEDRGGAGEGPVSYKWSKSPIVERRIGESIVQRATATAVIGARTSISMLDWVMVPYAFKPSVKLIGAFVKQLQIQFPRKRTIRHIVEQVRTTSGREKLRLCYDALWANHNLVSMCLYAGPERIKPKSCGLESGRWGTGSVAPAGWLSTGDFHLGRVGRRRALLDYYQRFTSTVGTVVVPHHGAADYFHSDLVNSFTKVRVGIAAAGKNGYGHPHKTVKKAVKQHHRIFSKVSSAKWSRVVMDAEF